MMELLKNTKIDFMSKRKYTFVISGVLVLLGLFALVQTILGNANMGIDFVGGTAIQVKFSEKIELAEVRRILEGGQITDFDLQDMPVENKILIRLKKQEEKLGAFSERVIDVITTKLVDKKPIIESVTEIGPKIGAKLRKDALFAIVMATIGLLIYVAWRFQFRFGVGATLATFHDVIVVFGIFYLLNKEINLVFVSALLTIAGYSLTDTVVVFDRIRENIKKLLKDPIETIINKSINEVLSRTIIVSLTTFLAALALFIFGGEVIHDFALAILIGIAVGTYSSIFIASPVVILLAKKQQSIIRKK
ncbi:MAG: protein translocase subunit SecF [Thermodesulfovibrionales bacterium]|nr:protein translocase subunit SecF [Thermodesulfovibrionales bacterium]